MEGVVAPPSPLLGLGSQVAGLALHSPAPLPAGLPADGPGATGFFHGQTSHRNPPQGGREGSDSCESSASASGPLSPAAGYAPSVSMPVGAAAAVIASAASKLGAPAGFAAPQPQASQGSPQNGNARDHIFSNFAPQAAKAMAPNTAAVIAQADVGPNLQQRVFSTPVQMQALKKNQNEMVGNWILGKTIGRGSFAEVRLARNVKTATPAQLSNPSAPYSAVVKITNLLQLHDPQIQRVQLQREIATLMELGDHPHIVKVLDVMQSPSRTYLFLEYIDGMELYDFLKGQPTGHVPEDIVRLITWQLLGALEYMTSKNVLHRDIKLDNVLLNKRGDVKIIDFNLATFVEKGQANLTEAVGCVHYAAPTILACAITKQPYADEGGWPDVWSLGVAVFSLLQGVFPFRSTNALRLLQEIKAMADSGGLLYPVPLSKLCRDFVSTMLNPRARPTATDLMRHPWMAGLARPEHVAKAPFQPTAPLPAQVTPSPPSTAFPAPAAPTEPFRKPLLRPSLGGRTATSSAVPTLANFAPAAAPSPAMVQPSADVRIAAAAQQPGQNGAPVRPQLQPRANTSSAVPTLRSFQAGAVHFNDPNDGTIAAEAEARRRLAMGQPAQQPHGGVTFAAPPSPAPQSPALFGYERPPLQPRANSYAHHHPHMPPPLANGMQAPVKRPSGNLAMDLPAGISGIPGSPGEGATSNRMSLDYIVSSVSQPVRSPGVETHGLPQTGYFAPRPAPTSPTSAYQHHHPHFVTPQPPSPGGKMPPYLARPQLQPRSISSGAVPTLRSFLAKASAAALDADAMDTSSTTDSDSEVGGEDQNRRSNPIPTPSGGLRRSKTTHGTGTSRRREHRETEYIAATPAARNDSGYGASNGSLADEMGSDDMEL